MKEKQNNLKKGEYNQKITIQLKYKINRLFVIFVEK